jgi:hypothetical protein
VRGGDRDARLLLCCSNKNQGDSDSLIEQCLQKENAEALVQRAVRFTVIYGWQGQCCEVQSEGLSKPPTLPGIAKLD